MVSYFSPNDTPSENNNSAEKLICKVRKTDTTDENTTTFIFTGTRLGGQSGFFVGHPEL